MEDMLERESEAEVAGELALARSACISILFVAACIASNMSVGTACACADMFSCSGLPVAPVLEGGGGAVGRAGGCRAFG